MKLSRSDFSIPLLSQTHSLKDPSHLSASQSITPRFGLKGAALQKHPAYDFYLRKNHHLTIDKDGSLHPTPDLINIVAQAVFEDKHRAPKAIVIKNITDFIPKFEYKEDSKGFQTIRDFQNEVFDAVWKKVQPALYPDTQRDDFLIHKMDIRHNRRIETERPMDTPESTNYLQFPYPTAHIAADDIFSAVSFGPVKNVQHAYFTLLDFEQYLKDHKLTFYDVFHHYSTEQSDGYFLRPEHRTDSLNRYSLEIQTRTPKNKPLVPIIFMNNRKMAQGINVTEPPVDLYRLNVHKVFMHRSSIRTKRKSSYWQQHQAFPYHTYWIHKGKPPEETQKIKF
ncbi:MAG: hypothetical protein KTR14_00970 [Vampirovibrio sp.]|nr:hypothetical protein [Vampirovibrio sp.]